MHDPASATVLPIDEAARSAGHRLAGGDPGAALDIAGGVLRADSNHRPALAVAEAAAWRLHGPDGAWPWTERAGMLAFAIGRQRADRGDRAGAVSAYRRGMALAPAQSFHYHFAGEALLAANRVPEAIRAFRRAVLVYREDLPSMLRLADLYRVLNMWAACRTVVRRALVHAPSHGRLYAIEAAVELALDRPDACLVAVGRAFRLAGDTPYFHRLRGLAHRDRGEPEQALPALCAALEADPDCPETRFAIALCAASAGRPAADGQAYAEVQRAAARAAGAAGDRREASRRYVRAIAAQPNDAATIAAHETLIAEWREALKDPARPIAERNPDWVFGECQRAEALYRSVLYAHPEL